MEKELPTRQFRKQPFCWQEKKILRLLKGKYNKRTLPYRRSVYLALTEIESDFGKEFVKNYTKTISTYAGINRQLVSKILKEFEKLGILHITILRNESGQFSGRKVDLLSISQPPLTEKPPVDEPPVVTIPHKKVISNKENNINKESVIIKNFKNERREIPVGDPPEGKEIKVDPVGLAKYHALKVPLVKKLAINE